MLKTVAFIVFLHLVATLSQSAPVVQQADRLFSYGEDPTRDRQSLDLLEKAISTDSRNYQLLWRAARGYYYAGEDANAAHKVGYYERGIAVARQAVTVSANAAEGHFWLGANYGGVGEQKGMFKAVQLIGKIRAEMETVVRLNPGYEDAKAYLALGELDRQLPWVMGGSTARAISYCEQGLKLAPGNAELKLSLAQAYLEGGRREDARRVLQEVIAQPINPARARAERGVRDEARRIQERAFGRGSS